MCAEDFTSREAPKPPNPPPGNRLLALPVAPTAQRSAPSAFGRTHGHQHPPSLLASSTFFFVTPSRQLANLFRWTRLITIYSRVHLIAPENRRRPISSLRGGFFPSLYICESARSAVLQESRFAPRNPPLPPPFTRLLVGTAFPPIVGV